MRTTSSREIYRNAWMSLREDRIVHPDGSPGLYSVVDKPAAACVIAVEEGGFHLIEQFRYPLGRRSWEFVQGTWPHDGPPGEELARAELAEETGLRAASLELLGRIAIAPGMTSQECDVFVARGLTPGPIAREVTEQEMEHRLFSADELEDMLRKGVITDSVTLAAYTLFLLRTP
ncbi:NUDIX domain-containing protein [Actinocorallia herbida]|uniref:NUDIX domain-containing protein n=1 Tax=Actinocorallia herbida TaxID=58109 RepID=A0A3N1CQG5_9ACTN|nr:NUDIX hydrolase [Actinocorallia herbida]ROO83533.1 NUDIX domain-containing protein [Actinocorallia herbida]